MECNLGTVEGVLRCVVAAKPWIEFALGLAGVGSLALLSALIWVIKRWREDGRLAVTEKSNLLGDVADRERLTRVAERERDAAFQMRELMEHTRDRAIGERDAAIAGLSGDVSAQQDRIKSDGLIISGLEQRLASVRAVSNGDSTAFWSRPVGALPPFRMQMRDSIAVTMFANQKGGVGKTTLATNVAACWAEAGENVLVLDLDYQASTTSLMLAQAGNRSSDFKSKTDLLFQPNLNEFWPDIAIESVPSCPRLKFIPTNYSFEQLERRLEYSWVVGDQPYDVRFLLRRIILSDFVQSKFNRVVIDAPPRFTLGFINGIACSTHLFVPTVVDMTSAYAVGLFARQFDTLREVINPQISFRGIIGTMTSVERIADAARPAVKAAEDAARAALSTNDDYFLRDALMRRDAKVSYSTEAGIAYLQEPSTRPMFKRIADEIARRAPSKRS